MVVCGLEDGVFWLHVCIFSCWSALLKIRLIVLGLYPLFLNRIFRLCSCSMANCLLEQLLM